MANTTFQIRTLSAAHHAALAEAGVEFDLWGKDGTILIDGEEMVNRALAVLKVGAEAHWTGRRGLRTLELTSPIGNNQASGGMQSTFVSSALSRLNSLVVEVELGVGSGRFICPETTKLVVSDALARGGFTIVSDPFQRADARICFFVTAIATEKAADKPTHVGCSIGCSVLTTAPGAPASELFAVWHRDGHLTSMPAHQLHRTLSFRLRGVCDEVMRDISLAKRYLVQSLDITAGAPVAQD